jgi:hypothetical protein
MRKRRRTLRRPYVIVVNPTTFADAARFRDFLISAGLHPRGDAIRAAMAARASGAKHPR